MGHGSIKQERFLETDVVVTPTRWEFFFILASPPVKWDGYENVQGEYYMNNLEVAIQRGENINETVKKALSLLGGLGNVIKRGDTVLIKPNYAVPMRSDTGATTNPQVVIGVIEAAKEAGAGDIIVAESSIVGFDAGKVMGELGVKEVFERAGATVINLDEDQNDMVERRVPRGKILKNIKIFRPASECDVLISVPVLKTHIYTRVSLGMKNLKGTLPDSQKKVFHRVGVRKPTEEPFELDRCISDMMTAHHPHFTVVDGIVGQEGFVAGSGVCGRPVKMNTIIAGKDFVAVDAVGAYIMGMDPLGVNHIRYAHERGLGEARMENVTILGEDINMVRRKFRAPIPGEIGNYENITAIEGPSCSGCSFAIRWVLSTLQPHQVEKWDKTVFLVGSDIEPREEIEGRPFLIGKCACRLPIKGAIKIRGCPPPFWYIMGALRKADLVR